MERGIIDGAIFEEDEIDPTEIYRDKVLFFFFISNHFKFTIFYMKYEITKILLRRRGKRKKEGNTRILHTLSLKSVFPTCFSSSSKNIVQRLL